MNAIISSKEQIVKAVTLQQLESQNQHMIDQKSCVKASMPENSRQDFSDQQILFGDSLLREMLYFDRF